MRNKKFYFETLILFKSNYKSKILLVFVYFYSLTNKLFSDFNFKLINYIIILSTN